MGPVGVFSVMPTSVRPQNVATELSKSVGGWEKHPNESVDETGLGWKKSEKGISSHR